MSDEIPHVCLVPVDGCVKYVSSTGERGSDPCLGRPWRHVANDIKARFVARDQRTTFEIVYPWLD